MAALKHRSFFNRDSFDNDTDSFDGFFPGPSHASSNGFDAAPGAKAATITGAIAINGTGGDDTLVVTATGADSGTYSLNGGPLIAFNHIASFTFNGGSGNDSITVINPDGGLFAP